GEDKVAALVRAGLHVAPINPDGRGAEEAKPRRGIGVSDLDQLDLRLQFELGGDLFDQVPCRFVVGAAVEVEDLDPRLSHPFGSSIRQQAATCSALSASNDSASSSIASTLSSPIRL